MFFFIILHKRTTLKRQRVDNYVIGAVKSGKKSFFYKLFRSHLVLLNYKSTTYRRFILKNSVISILAFCFFTQSHIVTFTKKNDKYKALVFLNTLYIDTDFIFVNKIFGIKTQKDRFSSFFFLKILQQLYGNVYQVHRLDKNTTGCMLFVRSIIFLNFVNNNFYIGRIRKKYYAVVEGVLYGEFYLCLTYKSVCIVHKTTLFKLRVVHNFYKTTFVEIMLITGRKHQIRVGLFFLRRSIIGDLKYTDVVYNNGNMCKDRLLLHCRELIVPKFANKCFVKVQAGLDYYFCNFIFLLFF